MSHRSIPHYLSATVTELDGAELEALAEFCAELAIGFPHRPRIAAVLIGLGETLEHEQAYRSAASAALLAEVFPPPAEVTGDVSGLPPWSESGA